MPALLGATTIVISKIGMPVSGLCHLTSRGRRIKFPLLRRYNFPAARGALGIIICRKQWGQVSQFPPTVWEMGDLTPGPLTPGPSICAKIPPSSDSCAQTCRREPCTRRLSGNDAFLISQPPGNGAVVTR